VDGEFVAFGDLLQQIDVAFDEARFGDDAEVVAFVLGEDFEDAACDADAALDGLVGVGCGADGDLFVGVDVAEFLFEEPGGVFFQIDFALEGQGPGLLRDVECAASRGCERCGLQELVSVAGEAVLAAEFAAAVGIDGVGHPELAFGDRAIEDGAGVHGFELDEVAVVGVLGFRGESGHADRGLGQDWE